MTAQPDPTRSGLAQVVVREDGITSDYTTRGHFRSLLELRGQLQHLAASLLAISGKGRIPAGGVNRHRGKEVLEPPGARKIKAKIGAP